MSAFGGGPGIPGNARSQAQKRLLLSTMLMRFSERRDRIGGSPSSHLPEASTPARLGRHSKKTHFHDRQSDTGGGAGGLRSPPRGSTHSTAGASSCLGNCLPPERAIPEEARQKPQPLLGPDLRSHLVFPAVSCGSHRLAPFMWGRRSGSFLRVHAGEEPSFFIILGVWVVAFSWRPPNLTLVNLPRKGTGQKLLDSSQNQPEVWRTRFRKGAGAREALDHS